MKPQRTKQSFAIGVWLLGFCLATWTLAAMLCVKQRFYVDDAGVDVHEVTAADSQVVWNLILSPVFFIPAIIVLLAGSALVWRLFSDNRSLR